MYSKVGLHIIKGTSLRLGHPPLVVLYNCDAAYYHQVRAEVGDDTIICFRADYAPWRQLTHEIAHPRTVVQAVNEPAVDTAEQAQELCRWELAHMRAVHEWGGHYCLFNLAVGNPANLGLWRHLRPAIDEMQPGDYVGQHAYWGDDPTNSWHVARWRHVPELAGVPIICTEGGIDVVEGGGARGWKRTGMSAEQYLGEIRQVDQFLQGDENVHGYALYTAGTENDPNWRDFEIRDVWPSIVAGQQGVTPPAQPPADKLRIFVNGHIEMLDVETYVKGVVGAEMYSSWPMDALRAQAVAARSYALAQRGRHSADGADLCATSHCQNYRPDRRTARTDQAVEDTQGIVATRAGKPAKLYYSASCGGTTYADWGPHLRARSDCPCQMISKSASGHQRGMCQWGAYWLAAQGLGWRDILDFYYDLDWRKE